MGRLPGAGGRAFPRLARRHTSEALMGFEEVGRPARPWPERCRNLSQRYVIIRFDSRSEHIPETLLKDSLPPLARTFRFFSRLCS